MEKLMSYDRFGIRNQIVSMFLVVILPSVAASIFLLLSIRNVAKDKSLETALSNADGLGYWVSDITAAGDQCTDSIAKSKVISDFLADPPAERSDYIRFYLENPISKTISVPAQVKNIYIYTSGDDFVYNSTFLEITDEVRESKWYQRARAARGVSWDVLKDTSDGEYKLACTRPVMNGDEMTGLVVVLMSNDWVKNVNIESNVKLVFSADGKVFYSTYEPLMAGSDLTVYKEYDSETASATYNGSLYGFRGYAVAKNMSYDRSSFQVALLLPEPYINYDTNRLTVIYAGYTGLMVVLSLLIILLFTNVFSSRVKTLSSKVHSVAGGNFNVNFEDSGRDEISQLYADISIMIENMQKLINDNYEAKLQSEAFKLNQMEAEFKALSSQINPHFLYNTLETIRMKAYVNNDRETADLVKKLGKFMRRCLEFKDGEVTLQSELEFTRAYLELQSARFGDRIGYSIYSEVAGDYMILPLLIQPLVENAYVHGVEGSKSKGRIDVSVYYHKDCVYIDVTDNGQGMSPEKLKELEHKLEVSDTSSGKSIGLTNVHKRIRMYHGKRYGMTISSTEGKGTTIRLVLPREPQTGLSVKGQ